MKILSIRQPWAYLIANGQKNIENRTWLTNYRGPFLIHASLALDRDG
jgi:ASCH domain